MNDLQHAKPPEALVLFCHCYRHTMNTELFLKHVLLKFMLGMGIENQLHAEPLKSNASKHANSFYQCQHVFLTVLHCKTMKSNSVSPRLHCWKLATRRSHGREKEMFRSLAYFHKKKKKKEQHEL